MMHSILASTSSDSAAMHRLVFAAALPLHAAIKKRAVRCQLKAGNKRNGSPTGSLENY